MRRSELRAGAAAAVAAFVVMAVCLAAEPVVHVDVFLSPDCPECKPVEQAVLKRMARELGCRIEARYFDVEEMANYRMLVALERRFGDAENDLPVVFVGERVFGSVEEIEKGFREYVGELAAAGGSAAIGLPGAEEVERALGVPAVEGTIHAVFFDRPGCRLCGRAYRVLTHFQRELGRDESGGERLVVDRIVREDREARLWQEVLGERAGVAQEKRLAAPSVFVGKDALVYEEVSDAGVAGLLGKYRTGAAAPAEASAEEREGAVSRLNGRFERIGFVTMVGGGLVDGINPCAFVTLLFLVGYLAASGRKGREILMAGGAFAAAVFCAYFLMGLGLAGLMGKLESLPVVSRVLTWVMIVAVFALAAVSMWDVVLAWRGRGSEAKLGLPGFLRRRLSLTVAREFRTRRVVAAAFVTGFVVSLLELVCTGQTYLPLLRLMISYSASRARALLFLAVYNGAFIVPLVVTFTAVYLGLTSEQLAGIFKRHLVVSKVLTTLLFVAIGVLLIKIG